MSASLTPLLDLPDVRPALDTARGAVDAALRHPGLRRQGGTVAAEATLRCAVASAALEGHRFELAEVREGIVTDPVVQGALRVNLALDGLVAQWPRAPRQVLARLHVLAARGCPGVDEASLGRPSASAGPAMARLDALCELLAAPAGAVPALLRAAVVHGELLVLGVFAGPNGVVARAAARLTVIANGLDPGGVLAVDEVHLVREPEYVGCVNSFATGTPDGLRAWLKHCAAAAEVAAATLLAELEAAASG